MMVIVGMFGSIKNNNNTWQQIGQDIDGDPGISESNGFSVSLSSDGSKVAIGLK